MATKHDVRKGDVLKQDFIFNIPYRVVLTVPKQGIILLPDANDLAKQIRGFEKDFLDPHFVNAFLRLNPDELDYLKVHAVRPASKN